MRKKVVITNLNFGQNHTEYIKLLQNEGYDVVWNTPASYDPHDTVKAVKGYDAAICGGEKYDKWALDILSDKLKIVIRHGIGVDNIDINAAKELGIAVTNAPGRNARAVAEHVLTMMLSLTRRITQFDCEMHSGIWKPRMTRELYGKTIGMVGFGTIARWLAVMLKGFNCTILAYDINFDEKRAAQLGVQFMEVDDMLPISDFVSLHIPLTSETEGSIGADFFSKMKPGSFFFNAARGKIVREKDLIEALENKVIKGAGLDVFENQPLSPNSPLCKMDNVMLSPHTSAVTEESMHDTMECSISDLKSFFEGRVPENLLNPGYEKFINGGSK